jgi:hypothetical protein
LVGKLEGKRLLGKQTLRWEDDIKMDLMGWCGLDNLAQVRGPVVGSCEHGNEPSSSIECWAFVEGLSKYWFLKNDSVLWS